MVRNEGLLSFYKGFQANFMRLGSWNVAMFVTLERIKIYFDPEHGKNN
jgi:solute carrier family 25 uncoupling protein 8/9